MSDSRQAVFLSYASQDADAARRIADALRAAGIEVWFDQNDPLDALGVHGLVGGDAWDAKIRKQIKECALFVPIISANTQARAEGYFRLEWRLADQRTHLMGKARAFLLPVCIDDTPDNAADVPDSFVAVQWIRLPAGGTDSDRKFTDRVKAMLAGGTAKTESVQAAVPARPPAGTAQTARGRSTQSARWRVAAAIALLAAIGAFWALWPGSGRTALDAATARSVAVLPFENLSSEPNSAYFASGMHEEVLTAVGRISALRVIGRASVIPYTDVQKRNLRQIAADLGIGSVVEGSVRQVGNRVRIAVQLVDAQSSRQLWADTFERELTDVFAIQAAIAQEVAGTLKARLTDSERAQLGQQLTKSAEAYRLYLEGLAAMRAVGTPNAGSIPRLDAGQAILNQAIAADPDFVLPHVLQTWAHGMRYWFGDMDPSPERARLLQASAAQVQRLAPDSVDARLVAGYLAYIYHHDWERALREFSAVTARQPNDAESLRWKANCLRRLGQWPQAVAELKRSAALDPQSLIVAESLAESEMAMRNYTEAKAIVDHYSRQGVTSPWLSWSRATSQFALDGNFETYRRSLAALESEAYANVRYAMWRRELSARDIPGMERIIAGRETMPGIANIIAEPTSLHRAMIAHLRGDDTRARSEAAAARSFLERTNWSRRQIPAAAASLALASALSGDRVAAQTALNRVTDAFRQTPDAFAETDLSYLTGIARILIGDRDGALSELRKSIRPSSANVPAILRRDPFWSRLADDPRFEQILNAPLP